MTYKHFEIFEKDGKYTVGSSQYDGFDACTLENCPFGDEFEMCIWNLDKGNEVMFVDLWSVSEEDLGFQKYLEHLEAYQNDSVEDEFIVPIVRFSTIELAKEFIDAFGY